MITLLDFCIHSPLGPDSYREGVYWLREASSFSSRKHTEYVLIGTFLSFGFAIMTGLVINWVLRF